jgi:hypothetical protein
MQLSRQAGAAKKAAVMNFPKLRGGTVKTITGQIK